MEQAIPTPRSSYVSLVRDRNYGSLWLGQLVSSAGDRIHQVALVALVGYLSGRNLLDVSFIFASIGLPSLLFGLFAGAVVDRLPRKWVMIVSDLLRAPLVVAIPFLAQLNLAWAYVLTFLITAVGLFFRPARSSVIPDIVPEDKLMQANSLSSATDSAVDVLGYPLAGALIAGLVRGSSSHFGISLAFYLDAGTYLFSALMISRVVVRAFGDESGRPRLTLGGMIVEGLSFLRSHGVILANLILFVVAVLVSYGSWTLTYGYATDVTHTGTFGYGLLEAALGVGATVGGLAMGRWGERAPKGLLVLAGFAVMGAANASLALFSNLIIATLMMALAGVGNMMSLIPSITLFQEHTPATMRGRVFGLRNSTITIAFICSNVLTGWGAAAVGVQPMYAVTGLALLVIVGLGFLWPNARRAR